MSEIITHKPYVVIDKSINNPKEHYTDFKDTPFPNSSIKWLDITPEERALANESKGAFNKRILKRIYDLNKEVSLDGQTGRIPYGLNMSGDHSYFPIGEFADDSDLFTFYIQGSSESVGLLNNVPPDLVLSYCIKYEEIVLISSPAFRHVDEQGNPISVNAYKAMNIKDKEIEYNNKFDRLREALLSKINAGIPSQRTREHFTIFLTGMKNIFETLLEYKISNNKYLLEKRSYIFETGMNIIATMYEYDVSSIHDRNQRFKVFSAEEWRELINHYKDLMESYGIKLNEYNLDN